MNSIQLECYQSILLLLSLGENELFDLIKDQSEKKNRVFSHKQRLVTYSQSGEQIY